MAGVMPGIRCFAYNAECRPGSRSASIILPEMETKMAVDQAVKTARGTKRHCAACESRFYDLGRSPIVCPSCGEVHVPETRRADARPGRLDWRADRFKVPVVVEAPEAIADEPVVAEIEGEEIEGAEAEDLADQDVLLDVTEEDNGDAADLIEPVVEEDERKD
jgi:uncharacterized protein (TIGR02300 family)